MIDLKKAFDDDYTVNELRHIHGNARYVYEAIDDYLAMWNEMKKTEDVEMCLTFLRYIQKQIIQ